MGEQEWSIVCALSMSHHGSSAAAWDGLGVSAVLK